MVIDFAPWNQFFSTRISDIFVYRLFQLLLKNRQNFLAAFTNSLIQRNYSGSGKITAYPGPVTIQECPIFVQADRQSYTPVCLAL